MKMMRKGCDGIYNQARGKILEFTIALVAEKAWL